MNADEKTDPIGEVIVSSSSSLIAQCARSSAGVSFPDPPALGSFVCIPLNGSIGPVKPLQAADEDPFVKRTAKALVTPHCVFGIISNIQTSSLDPNRRPVALGISSLEELRRSQPQIFELMTVEFTVALISFSMPSGELYNRLPPKPPHIHSSVIACSDNDQRVLTDDLSFIRSLLSSGGSGAFNTDDIIAAAIVHGYEAQSCCDEYLVRSGKALLRQLGGDYIRFQSIMQRIV